MNNLFQRKLELRIYGLVNIVHPIRSSRVMHIHNFWQLDLACSGSANLKLVDTLHSFNEGDIVIIPPGVPHYFDYGESKHYRGFSFKFDLFTKHQSSNFAAELIKKDSNSQLIIDTVTNLFNGFFPAENLWENRQFTVSQGASYPMLMEGILFGMLRFFYFTRPEAQSDEEFIYKIQELISRQPQQSLTVNNLAKALNYSPRHLRFLVKKHTGKSPKQLIDAERLRLTKEYLHYSTLNINEIADEMGFCDAIYFNRFFRKYTGMTPSNYRKNSRQQ